MSEDTLDEDFKYLEELYERVDNLTRFPVLNAAQEIKAINVAIRHFEGILDSLTQWP